MITRINTKSISTIEKITKPSPELFYNKYVKLGCPVVITGLIDHWPALSEWNFEFFKANYANHNVTVECSHLHPVPTDPVLYLKNRYYKNMLLGEVINNIRNKGSDSGFYVTYANIFQSCPELLNYVHPLNKNLGFPKWYNLKLRNLLSLRPGFWLGPEGANSPTHFDRQENLNVQIYGHKKWILFSPEESKALYFAKNSNLAVIFSPVDINNPDLKLFPLYKNSTFIEVILNPGEIIYVPPGWWHQVQSLDETITLNYWWWSFRGYKTVMRVTFYYMLQRLYNMFKKREIPISMPLK